MGLWEGRGLWGFEGRGWGLLGRRMGFWGVLGGYCIALKQKVGDG